MARRFLVLNGLAIIGIVVHHAAAYGLLAMFEWTDRYLPVTVPNYDQMGSPAYLILMTVRLLLSVALPAFFFVSGYFIGFLGRGKQSRVTLKMVLPRVKVLIIPFLIWTVLRILLVRQRPGSIDDILNPYHFIIVLIQFYLLAPLLVAAARKNWRLLLLGAWLLQLLLPAMRMLELLGVSSGLQDVIGQMPRWIFLFNHPFWFPFGVVAGLELINSKDGLLKYRRVLLGGSVLFGVLVLAEYFLLDAYLGSEWLGPEFAGIARHPFSLLVILTYLAYDKLNVPFSRELSDIGVRSLGIYLANIPSVYATAVLMYRFTPALLGYPLIYVSILVATGLGIPLLLMAAVRRAPVRRVRSSYRYLFG